MPKRRGSQNKGGCIVGGAPAKALNTAKNAGHSLSQEVRDAISALPQITSREWSKSYLAEQLWRNYLGLNADYDADDLGLIAKHQVIE